MKKLLVFSLMAVILIPAKAQESEAFFNEAQHFFATYVDKKGLVDYAALKAQPQNLNALVEAVGVFDVESI